MCGRYAIAADTEDLAAALGVKALPGFQDPPRYNIAPTSTVPILVQAAAETDAFAESTPLASTELHTARWGLLPSWAPDLTFSTRTFNARSETLTEKPSFRSAVATSRCAIPASAYYEWAGDAGKTTPYAVVPEKGRFLLFAGLFSWWRNPEADAVHEESTPWLLSCTIITQASPSPDTPGILGELGRLHPRLPLALSPAGCAAWIAPGRHNAQQSNDLLDRLRADSAEEAASWQIHPVDPRVGKVSQDDPELLSPWRPAAAQDTLDVPL